VDTVAPAVNAVQIQFRLKTTEQMDRLAIVIKMPHHYFSLFFSAVKNACMAGDFIGTSQGSIKRNIPTIDCRNGIAYFGITLFPA
jgi:hypothetical protein